jgi:primosomal protein N' (replication factor Y)
MPNSQLLITPMFAEIVVNAPLTRKRIAATQRTEGYTALDQTFTYAIPQALVGRLQAGQLVTVPFGARKLQGIVMALSETTTVERLKEVADIAAPLPVLSPAQLALARWLSAHYFTPLIECVLPMFPPGLESEAQTLIKLNPDAPSLTNPKESQKLIIERLQAGPLSLEQLIEGDHKKELLREVEALARRRIVLRESVLLPPRAKEKREQTAQLVTEPSSEQIVEARKEAAPIQKAVFDYLKQHEASEGVSAKVLKEATGATSETLKTLAEARIITLKERTVGLVAEPSKEMLTALHAPRQSAVLAYLLQQGGLNAIIPTRELMRATGAHKATLKALAEAGFIRFDERVVWRDPLKAQAFLLTESPALTNEQQAVWDVIRAALRHKRTGDGGQETEADMHIAATTSNVEPSTSSAELSTSHIESAISKVETSTSDIAAPSSTPDAAPPSLTSNIEYPISNAEPPTSNLQLPTSNSQFPMTFLLFGVTGSGKTEIYLRAVDEVLKQKRQAIVLVPEVALTPQTTRRFAERFPKQVMVMHSYLSLGERFDQWRRIRAGEVNVVIGSRSAIFAPLPRLGLIVIDEEHEYTYKQDVTPRYHAREVALRYAQLTGATVILGSATPALESMWRAEQGAYRLLRLTQRVQNPEFDVEPTELTRQTNHQQSTLNNRTVRDRGDAAKVGLATGARAYLTRADLLVPPPLGIARAPYGFPPMTIVDMREELKAGNTSIFSRTLRDALAATLKAREQAILFLNRRGTATFVLCRDCGFVLKCQPCDNPVTYHADQNDLVCHHCNRRYQMPKQCPHCLSARIKQFGAGTQKVEEVVMQLFPTARVVRWDRDTTGARGAHDKILKQFAAHKADVLVGTQMIAKGLDVPLVTLVGVISADTALNLPDFRASERTFQLLMQVGGRAGRAHLPSQVILQTYAPTHPAIVAAAQYDYVNFYQSELEFRRRLHYPPFGQLVRLVYAGGKERAQSEAESLQRSLSQRIRQLGLSDVELVGPAPCFVHKVRSEYRWQILVKGMHAHELVEGFLLPLGWRVDVEPMSML